jgi:multidrug efflux system membrane fusion protein
MLDKWTFERERVRRLEESDRSNPKEVNDTEMEYWAAERRYAQAQAMLDLAREGARTEERERAAAEVSAQEAVVRRLERDLAKTEIRAPLDGFVVVKRTELGEWIEAGGPVCEMVSIETVRVRADVPESAIPFAAVGARATFDIEALGLTLSQPIARVIPRAITTARTFPIEIDVPNAEHKLLPGMFVWVNVPSGAPGKRLMVSKDAIVPRGREKTLFIVRPGERGAVAMQVPVETGLEIGGEIEIRGPGISAGDQVVARANERLFPFAPVIVMPSTATTQPAIAGEGADAPVSNGGGGGSGGG